MKTETSKVHRELSDWARRQPAVTRAHAMLICGNLRLLERNPDNLPLRVQTMKNVTALATVANQ